jgi:transcriptional regulator with XRE-family HTH domain
VIVGIKQAILQAVDDRRHALGMKQGDISDVLGRTQPFISQVLAGEHSHIAGDDLDAIARLFSCQLVVVVEGSGEGVSLLEHLPETSELIPYVWQRILRLLELDIIVQTIAPRQG